MYRKKGGFVVASIFDRRGLAGLFLEALPFGFDDDFLGAMAE